MPGIRAIGNKRDGSTVTFGSEAEAMKSLEPGMSVKLMRGDKERVMFTVTGRQDAVDRFGREAKRISDEWTEKKGEAS